MDHDLPLYGLGIALRPASTTSTISALDHHGRPVVAVAVADGRTDRVFTGAEAFLLTRLDEFLADQPAGLLATWGRPDDDLTLLADRAHRLRVGVGLRVRPGTGSNCRRASWHHHTHLDAGLAPLRRDVTTASDTDALTARAAREARLVRRLVTARRAAAEADRPRVATPPLPHDRDDHGPRGAAVG